MVHDKQGFKAILSSVNTTKLKSLNFIPSVKLEQKFIMRMQKVSRKFEKQEYGVFQIVYN